MASLRPDPKPACKKCGYPGHLTFECRNTISLGNATTSVNAAAVVLDVSSTSSDSSDDDDDLHTPLTKLRAEELKEKLKKRRRREKEKKRDKKRRKSTSDSDSDSSDERSRKKRRKEGKEKKAKKEKKRKKKRRSKSKKLNLMTGANQSFRHVLITGPPGVGKTTLVKKVCMRLSMAGCEKAVAGFYTEEIRGEKDGRRQRLGFDVVDVADDKRRAPLARLEGHSAGPMVGKYTVKVKEFEEMAIDLLQGAEREQESDFFLVLDEIGKMELLSSKFSSGVQQLFDKDHQRIICTIPVSSAGRQNKILEKIRARRDARLFEVTKENRNELVDVIISATQQKET